MDMEKIDIDCDDFRDVSPMPAPNELSLFAEEASTTALPTANLSPRQATSVLLRSHFFRLRRILHNAIRSELDYEEALTYGPDSLRSVTISNLFRLDPPNPDKEEETEDEDEDEDEESEEEAEETEEENVTLMEGYDQDDPPDHPEGPLNLCWRSTDDLAGRDMTSNHPLCCLILNGHLLTLASIFSHKLDSSQCHVALRDGFPFNLPFIVRALSDTLGSSVVQLVKLKTSAWRLLPVLEALQKLHDLPLWEELVSCSNPPPPVPTPKLTELVQLLEQKDVQSIYRKFSLKDLHHFIDEGNSPSIIINCASAFKQRVSLLENRTGGDICFLVGLLVKSFYICSDQKILVICSSVEALEQTRGYFTRMNIPEDASQPIFMPSRWDVNDIWKKHSLSAADPYLVTRHRIDELRIQSRSIKEAIHRAVEVKQKPLHLCPELMKLLEQSAEYSNHFKAFSSIKLTSKEEMAPDSPGLDELRDAVFDSWCDGESAGGIPLGVVVLNQEIWQESPERRNRIVEKWRVGLQRFCTKKLRNLVKEYDDCQKAFDWAILQHARTAIGFQNARVLLCVSQRIPLDLVSLSSVEAGTVIVQDADHLDEAMLLAALPKKTNRLILTKDCQHPQRSSHLAARLDTRLETKSLWNRLVSQGFQRIGVYPPKDPQIDAEIRSDQQNLQNRPSGCKTLERAPVIEEDIIPGSEAWKTLQQMVGLESLKQHVLLLHQRTKSDAQRKEKGLPVQPRSLNGVFIGPPGTGKTTVARLYGQILADLGLIRSGQVIEKTGHELMGEYVGHTEGNMRRAFENAKGKLLIIDDAYTLWGGGGDRSHSFQKSAIDTLVSCASNTEASNSCVLLLGYDDQIDEMFRHAHPGLWRRFPLSNAFRFEAYSAQELEGILERQLEQARLSVTPEAKIAAMSLIQHAMVSPRFGNASYVEQLVDAAQSSLERRCLRDTNQDPSVLQPKDFSKDWDRVFDAEEECRKLFEGVIGCDSVISQFLQDIRVAKKAQVRDLELRDFIPFNYIFRGPPGTGKTTTARRMGQILYHMGILASSEVIESSVTDLIREYIGRTGPKVLDLFEKALGKVLFIDEAYRLHELAAQTSNFAQDAVGEIVGALTNPRFHQKMVIILAGYSEGMDAFLATNPGLRSRFKRIMTFDGLDGVQCAQLLVQVVAKRGVDVSSMGIPQYETHSELCDLFTKLSTLNGWGNARDVNTLGENIFRAVLLSSNDSHHPLVATLDTMTDAVREMGVSRGGHF